MKTDQIETYGIYEGRKGDRRKVVKISIVMGNFWVDWRSDPDNYLERTQFMRRDEFAKWARKRVN